jgi:hypothetical protein
MAHALANNFDPMPVVLTLTADIPRWNGRIIDIAAPQ